MATATIRGDKTKFVNDFLTKNPQGNLKAVNEAWAADGMTGTISKSVVERTRAKLGLTSNLRRNTKAAPNKPRIATATPGKGSFVREFLHDHPEGTAREVNEAWLAAGMKGTISHPVISEVRKQMGLTGTQSAKTSKPGKKKSAPKKSRPAKKKAAPKLSKPALLTPGRTMFVKEFLNDRPQGNVIDVNKAWQAAGFEGTVSRTLVDKVRALLGLTGNQRGKPKTSTKGKASPSGKKLGRPRKETTAMVSVQPRDSRSSVLEDLEADIDRLIFKLMTVGELTEIEDTLRRARRLLYGALTRG